MMRLHTDAGLSLVEATIVLAAIAVLTAATAPVTARIVDQAKLARAVDDEEAIKTAILNFVSENVGYNGFVVDGTSKSSTPVQLLVSDGDTPVRVSATGDSKWRSPVALTPAAGYLITDFLERHLVTNNPFGTALAYTTTTWAGTYISAPIDPDPWGNRYAVNTQFLKAPSDTKNDVFVLSAGPDREIDTAYQKDGAYPGDDDILVMVHRDRNTVVP